MAESKKQLVGCNQFLSTAAPTFSKLADFFAPNRTCYSTVSPPADEGRDGVWNYNTCPNCRNARVYQSRSKKKDSLKRKEPDGGPLASSSDQSDVLRQFQQQQQQFLLLFAQQQQQLQLLQQQQSVQSPRPSARPPPIPTFGTSPLRSVQLCAEQSTVPAPSSSLMYVLFILHRRHLASSASSSYRRHLLHHKRRHASSSSSSSCIIIIITMHFLSNMKCH